MWKWKIFLLLLFLPLSAEPIKRIQVFGERCSGTTFLEQLIRRNLKKVSLKFHYGMKHFPCWFAYPYDEDFYRRPLSDYTLENSNDVLFLVIFRDPYDWVRSFHKTPHFATESVRKLDFNAFIRSPWLVEAPEKHPWITPIELNPETREPFENVLKLRTARIRNMLLLKGLVEHVYFLNYETLKEDPEDFLKKVCQLFEIERKEEFVSIDDYKGNKKFGLFQESTYPPISKEDLRYIRKNLDRDLEASIGYLLE